MKTYKTSLHIMLSVVSLAGFAGGWAALAHSGKPIQPAGSDTQALEPLAPLDPIPAIGAGPAAQQQNNDGFFAFSQQPGRVRSRPNFRTGGS